MPEITLAEAVTQALAYELGADENVIVMGEDVGLNGGVFRVTVGLQEKFGKERVIDTPLAEHPPFILNDFLRERHERPGGFKTNLHVFLHRCKRGCAKNFSDVICQGSAQ